MEGLAGDGGGELRAQLGDDAGVVAVPVSLDHHQGVGVGLAEEVLRLVDLVGGVHRHQHGADLGGGPEGDEPGGHVGGPHGHLVPGLHPHGDEAPGELVHVVPELAVGPGVVQGGVLKAVLVRELLHHPVQHLGEGAVDDDVLLPHVLPLAGLAVVEVLPPRLPGVGGHGDGEVGQNHLQVPVALRPLGVPLEGEEAVVVHRAQGVHQSLEGQVPLPDELVAHLGAPAAGGAVADADVADVGPQVGDGLLGTFLGTQAGVEHAPAGGQVVAGEVVQHLHQPPGVGHAAAALQQQHHPGALRGLHQGGQLLLDSGAVAAGSVDHHIGHQQVGGSLQGGGGLGGGILRRQVRLHPHAGHLQPLAHQLPPGNHRQLRVHRAHPLAEDGVVYAVDLQSRQTAVRRGGAELAPVHAGPVANGKGELHGLLIPPRRRSCSAR